MLKVGEKYRALRQPFCGWVATASRKMYEPKCVTRLEKALGGNRFVGCLGDQKEMSLYDEVVTRNNAGNHYFSWFR